jgi:hypothetical protein
MELVLTEFENNELEIQCSATAASKYLKIFMTLQGQICRRIFIIKN